MLSSAKIVIKTEYKPKYFLQSKHSMWQYLYEFVIYEYA